jgi:hypothetical protein
VQALNRLAGAACALLEAIRPDQVRHDSEGRGALLWFSFFFEMWCAINGEFAGYKW